MGTTQALSAATTATIEGEEEERRVLLTPGRVVSPGRWNSDRVAAALDNQLNGDFDGVVSLFRAMMRDETMAANARGRISSLIQSQLTFEGDQEAADWLGNRYPIILPEDELSELCLWYHGISTGIGQLKLVHEDGEYALKLKTLDPYGLRWDYACSPGLEPGSYAIPGWSWNDAKLGRIPIEAGKNGMVILTKYKPGTNSGAAAELGHIWQKKRFMLGSLVDYLDQLGYPLTHVGGVPDAHRKAVAREIAHARASKSIVTPENYTVSVLASSPGADPAGHMDFINYADRKTTIFWKGANLAGEMAEGGSYSAAQVHEGVERRIIKADAENISTQLRWQVFQPNLEVNGHATVCPYPRWRVEEPEDSSQKMATINAFLDMVGKAKDLGLSIANMDDLAALAGLELSPKVAPPEGPTE